MHVICENLYANLSHHFWERWRCLNILCTNTFFCLRSIGFLDNSIICLYYDRLELELCRFKKKLIFNFIFRHFTWVSKIKKKFLAIRSSPKIHRFLPTYVNMTNRGNFKDDLTNRKNCLIFYWRHCFETKIDI